MKPLSPLRYPGGKFKALSQILPRFPEFKEYREPFLGGGSVLLETKSRFPDRTYWGNDLNRHLFHFWEVLQCCPDTFTSILTAQRQYCTDGRRLWDRLHNTDTTKWTHFDIAYRYFILNRISFSGAVDCAGYSEDSFQKRFTDSAIARIGTASRVIQGVQLTNLDYQDLVNTPGEDVFIFLDPPYRSAMSSKLYGRNGDLHTGFDFGKLSETLRGSSHKWLMTIDDCPEIRDLFRWANIEEWSLQYGMGNGSGTAPKGKELFISNY